MTPDRNLYMFAIIGLLAVLAVLTFFYLQSRSCGNSNQEKERFEEIERPKIRIKEREEDDDEPSFRPWNDSVPKKRKSYKRCVCEEN